MKDRFHNRMIALLLTLLFCVSLAPRASAEGIGDYLDLDPRAWYEQGVRYCLERGVMSGYGTANRYFNPSGLVTRAELATIIWRMEGAPKTGTSLRFDDVEEGAWYEEAVRWILLTGIMETKTPSVFETKRPVTRDQFAMVLWRYADYRNGFVPKIDDPEFETYDDGDKVSPEALEAMRWACALGIFTAVTDSTDGRYVISPWAPVRRAAAATILMRFSLDMGIYD